jgi:cytochrome c biogenesis protein CcmG, thiol:disulfide interchange protein DsbE
MPSDGARDALAALCARYSLLNNYMMDGRQSFTIPGTDCVGEVEIQFAKGGPSRASAGQPRQLFLPVVHFSRTKISAPCMEESKKRLGEQPYYSDWAHMDLTALGARSVHVLPEQTLHLSEGDVRCSLLEVTYDPYYEKIKDIVGPRRYWIDVKSGLVRRIEFTHATEYGPQEWRVVFDKVDLDTTPPEWASHPTREDSASPLIGKSAPDFTLLTSDGKQLRLSEFRGRIVALNFWATWCGVCANEIPVIEELQVSLMSSQVVVLGITDEDASVVQAWSERYRRHFRTLVDARKTFEDFAIYAIPVTVTIDRNGIVTDYIHGLRSDGELRELIQKR